MRPVSEMGFVPVLSTPPLEKIVVRIAWPARVLAFDCHVYSIWLVLRMPNYAISQLPLAPIGIEIGGEANVHNPHFCQPTRSFCQYQQVSDPYRRTRSSTKPGNPEHASPPYCFASHTTRSLRYYPAARSGNLSRILSTKRDRAGDVRRGLGAFNSTGSFSSHNPLDALAVRPVAPQTNTTTEEDHHKLTDPVVNNGALLGSHPFFSKSHGEKGPSLGEQRVKAPQRHEQFWSPDACPP
jgi:hypothetical protein